MRLKYVIFLGVACWIFAAICLEIWWQLVNGEALLTGNMQYEDLQWLLDAFAWLIAIGMWCVFIPIIYHLGSVLSDRLARKKSNESGQFNP
ncbi:MAG: hypothetical protein KDA86_05350 [Planctomycetaceae bacterium]|nr:hypothetical protein [Planctomycetaceae bacterium]MCA9109601.1 hypothetical protein [Planctomycetaceae bacterium]